MPAAIPTSGDVQRRVFASALLAENPLGDPATRNVFVYTPPGYAKEPEKRYPVVFLLTGYLGVGAKLLNWSAFEPTLLDRLDRLAAQGPEYEAIVVFPDCFTSYGGSQYMNSPAVGRYGDYLARELAPFIDREFRTLGDGGRGIAGHSSGGYGALVQVMRHPEIWSAVACHRGDMAFALCYGRDFAAACGALDRAGGMEAWLTEFRAKEKKSGDDITTLSIIAMAACYSPNMAREPIPIDLPFAIATCELIPAVWERWLAHDPLRLVEEEPNQAALRGLKLLMIEAATRDEYGLHFGARRLIRRLAEVGIPHAYAEHDDTHSSNMAQRYEESLARLIPRLYHA